ncbi:hypothetical protein LBMAG27_19820 [Bacteroidota bacterium]|nr:hypothetical protein LBMAG27_19820 [Bacteroidota bacterium]
MLAPMSKKIFDSFDNSIKIRTHSYSNPVTPSQNKRRERKLVGFVMNLIFCPWPRLILKDPLIGILNFEGSIAENGLRIFL